MKSKIVVIFPKYVPDDSSHYPYWYKVFEKVQDDLDIYILFETPSKRDSLPFRNYTFQKITTKPFNLIERLILLIKLRLQGYTHFYVHYSIWSLFIAIIITIILRGKTYLWDCEYYEKEIPNKLQKFALKSTDVLVTGHKKIADQYKKVLNLPNKPTKIIRNWVPEPTSSKTPKTSQHTNILFIHHLSPRKGSRELPEIIKQTIKEHLNSHFTIIGDGPDKDWLQQQITTQDLTNHVTFTGQLTQAQTQKYWQQADIFIMPSRAEGFPRVILEAQAHGVPYVATDVGCVMEISPKLQQYYIISPAQPEDFAQKLFELINTNTNAKIQISNQNIQNVKKYSLQNATQEFIQIFTNE